jgi:hypothetical protein
LVYLFLEISGIRKETATNNIDIRIRAKVRQINKKAKIKLELYTIVTEFSKPAAKIIKNELG